MGEVWPTAYEAELRLTVGSEPTETEMSTTLQTQSCGRALLTTEVLPFTLPTVTS